ncbi:MAG: DUF4835 family protein [Chitinophagia bacterium]|nr:DUF4835 family protein [Chitinophagia bacterium]NCA30585.1 DUF4835 family protein [Chitinophagia bacterium]NDD15927.1 DUF4835 family protein [Chitinophagia bacterium]
MRKKLLSTIILMSCMLHLLHAQELAATITIQSSKVDNQVDPKIFPQLQIQLKDFINQRKWSNDAFSNEEKIDCSFYITIETVVAPGIYDAKLSIVSNRPIHNASYSSSVLNMQDAKFTFKYQLSQPIEFNENRIQGADPLESNLTATIAYYIYIILGLDYDSFSPKAGMPYFNKALNIVYNAPEGSGISGWKSYDGQRNRYILIDNLTKSGNDKVHDVIYSYYREGLDQMTEKPELAKSNILNALINLQDMNEGAVSGMLIPIIIQAKFSEIVGIFSNSDKATRKQLITTLSSLDIANINKYKEKLE